MTASDIELQVVIDDQSVRTVAARGAMHRIRLVIGILGLLAIGHRIYVAEQDIEHARGFDPSAIQIVQLWTPHIFYMIAIIGAIIACYVISRSDS